LAGLLAQVLNLYEGARFAMSRSKAEAEEQRRAEGRKKLGKPAAPPSEGPHPKRKRAAPTRKAAAASPAPPIISKLAQRPTVSLAALPTG
jgi:hypothetical protein